MDRGTENLGLDLGNEVVGWDFVGAKGEVEEVVGDGIKVLQIEDQRGGRAFGVKEKEIEELDWWVLGGGAV